MATSLAEDAALLDFLSSAAAWGTLEKEHTKNCKNIKRESRTVEPFAAL